MRVVPRSGSARRRSLRERTADDRVNDERLRRWRLVLGGEAGADGTGYGADRRRPAIDGALAALYQRRANARRVAGRSGGLGASAPNVARWLGDIRTYFPSSVVQVMQPDAIERLNLTRLLLEPEMLEAVEPDVHLVGTLLSLGRRDAGEDEAHRPDGRRQGRRRAGAPGRAEDEGRGHRRAQPGRARSTGRGTTTSTGTGRSART